MARRSRAREVVLQLLFQWDQNSTPVPRKAIQQFVYDRLLGDAEMARYALALYDGVTSQKEAIDAALKSAADNWRLTRMTPVDRNVLRLGTYELLLDPDKQPLEVVLNEAIELAKRFGSEESPRFVNGVLDKVSKSPIDPANLVSAPAKVAQPVEPVKSPLAPRPEVAPVRPQPAPTRSQPAGVGLVHRIAYHNTEKMGQALCDGNPFGVKTNKDTKNWLGDVIWFIQGDGLERRQFSLASVFVVDSVGSDPDPTLPKSAVGEHGHLFEPPIPLNTLTWFTQLKETMANFSVCPQRLNDEDIICELLRLAEQAQFRVVD